MTFMSFQEEEKEITDLRRKEQGKINLSSIDVHIHDYYENVISPSNIFPQKNKVPPLYFDDLINNNLAIKTLKDIKYNFIEEHRNIINTYYSIYSQRLNDIIYYNLDFESFIWYYYYQYYLIFANLYVSVYAQDNQYYYNTNEIIILHL